MQTLTDMSREEILEKHVKRIATMVVGDLFTIAETDWLDRQLGAVCNLIKSKLAVAETLQKKSWTLQEHRLKFLEEALESEKIMNAMLTEELENTKPC